MIIMEISAITVLSSSRYTIQISLINILILFKMDNLLTTFKEQLIDPYPELQNIPDDLILLSMIKELPEDTPENILNNFKEKYGSNDYDRLEFLGDSVLYLITAEILFNNFDVVSSGDLTITRAKIVRNVSLACLMAQTSICDLVIGNPDDKTCADIFESIVGAIYYHLRSTGQSNIIDFIKIWLNQAWNYENILTHIIYNPEIKDACSVVGLSPEKLTEKSILPGSPIKAGKSYKVLLKELYDKKGLGQVRYFKLYGRPEAKNWLVGIICDKKPNWCRNMIYKIGGYPQNIISHGRGKNKKEAELQAAEMLYRKLTQD